MTDTENGLSLKIGCDGLTQCCSIVEINLLSWILSVVPSGHQVLFASWVSLPTSTVEMIVSGQMLEIPYYLFPDLV